MLRDVIVHIANEQPLLADLISEPAPSDVALICTNVRTMNGKKPVFIDSGDSTFVFPIVHIRFVEVPRTSMESHAAEASSAAAERQARLALPAPDGSGSAPSNEPAAAPAAPQPPVPELPPVNPDDLDPDLMRRIREA
jgi:hypothetical protein